MTPALLERRVPPPALSQQSTRGARSRPRPAASDAFPLVLRGVCKRWGRLEAPVLEALDLALEPGTATWVGGSNGAGKTTMLRIAAALIHPERGSVKVWGVSARENRFRYQQLVSFLPAGDRGLYARLTVRGQLEFCARMAMLRPASVRRAVQRALCAFELDGLAERRVDRISMGQRQRLRIAMTFLPDPEVVLLDEPLNSLDADACGLLRRAIADLLSRSGAVLWCSPSAEAGTAFDQRWIIERGRLVGA
jgi:ABC-2 type transport system ATP-binding protein